MFDIPGFNPSSMTDDELMNRQAELSRRFGWANRFSTSTDIPGQLWAMISAIDAERRDRMLKMIFKERDKMFPEIIETEPEMASQHKRKIVDDEKDQRMINRRKVGKDRLTLTKSSTPPRQQPHYTDEKKEK
jgi:hypothetical protein